MSENRLVKGLVLAHGAMAEGLVDAVSRIAGVADGVLTCLSNDGKSPEMLQEEVGKFIGKGPIIIFTDLPSGSCAVTARLCCRENGEEAVISGVNLPILLDFVFHRDLPLEALVPRLLEKGKGSVKSTPDFSGSLAP
jgi:mannose/fructose-specific phosphotransferase system component IIA